MHYTITAYSTALFSTWIFIDELGILFDAGDGLSASLLQKSRKIKQVFISHADRDHLTGLLQFNQLNARAGYPKIYYPSDCGSFPPLQSFSIKFDPHVSGTEWIPIKENMEFRVKGDLYVQSIRNNHVKAEKDISKSLSYQVVRNKMKIKPEYEKTSGKEIAKLVKERGRAFISRPVTDKLIGYSGDTPVENYDRWDGTKILIHEATFLTPEDGLTNHAHKHSNLDDVMKMVSSIKIEKLILSHFSSRYSEQQIDDAIIQLIKKYQVKIPVYRILPGKVHRNILDETPILQ